MKTETTKKIKEINSDIIVNNPRNGLRKYNAIFQKEAFNEKEKYSFVVYANNEDDATDILFNYIAKYNKELVADVPCGFTNDWGYDDDGGYTPYGEECPYLFNTDGTIAVNADEFISMDEIN